MKAYFGNREAYSEVQDNLPFQVVKIIKNIPTIDYSIFRDKFCKYDNKYSADQAKEFYLADIRMII